MKALTICQPYAELIARGDKIIENRTWPTAYRGPLVIHAGKSREWLEPDDLTDYPTMAFGAIVAIADLINCQRFEQLSVDLQRHEHANGPWCFVLANVRRTAVIPYRGAQGFFDVPDAILSVGDAPT